MNPIAEDILMHYGMPKRSVDILGVQEITLINIAEIF